MGFQEFKNHVLTKINLRENTSILEGSDQLRPEKIENGILVIWINWSPGYINCVNTINYLYSKEYKGQINIIDTDAIPRDFQAKIFGQVLHGWGEIFVIEKGQIIKEFRGKESSLNFRKYFDEFSAK